MTKDAAVLRAALAGYRNHLAEIDRAIADLRRRISRAGPGSKRVSSARPRTPEGRRRGRATPGRD